MRSKKAISGSLLQTTGSGPTSPAKRASPCALRGTGGLSTRTEFSPPALPSRSQTSVPFTWLTPAGVPIGSPVKAPRLDVCLLHVLGTVFQLAQETALGFKIIRGRVTKTSLLSLCEFDRQRCHDLLRHFILQRENVL